MTSVVLITTRMSLAWSMSELQRNTTEGLKTRVNVTQGEETVLAGGGMIRR